MQNSDNEGVIVLGATPIGNLSDASPRLREIMATADIIAAEDTRNFHHLAHALGIKINAKVMSLHEHNEAHKLTEVLELATEGATVLVVSDAGMPAVSDPGYPLVAAAMSAGIRVTAVPGPSAVLTALALSGLPTGRFTFEGFLPRKTGERRKRLDSLLNEDRTMVFFEAPHRLNDFLDAAIEAFGPEREAAVARELTKKFEEVRRDSLSGLRAWAEDGVRGEIVVVVHGAPEADAASIEDLLPKVASLVDEGVRMKQAVADVAEKFGAKKRELYEAVLASRHEAEK
ncbi:MULTISPECIES: 16S rRNA (cytidine(1402)-2'-O)-methyltransferase [Glutamicibacter]|uniref:Ribosomal RNA small subunit methyltransferase I n=2 Tax=Glutamicibacter arilaitensis TaxID=256701 RepID=A0A2N7S6N7_9MICC|nr:MULTISPECIES: 16S rRNA (cytidine(1402)-2'-O)-methyltransferase [Glutamicibacter]PMQ21803.1 16S rRNA (cytidine(1402)-2'-O)-methyltransferase [Glutamicibacter arilaitensis]CBT75003.1 putative tetrapyrrole methylase [Glutamicibacter arilaitensis Re117]HCH48524.1 16S rRNA (cytidine(1402)-2'-O)-methyltransferase [Glutamicibacter sp.]HCJ54628.1 16S rRNA (cytidine(1402)-2'-O)-methyltransferase [Glutamicibacter sp.]HCM93487.1 16S rRNA (cytidine(1402)-2'-O)-methyltransferase [Glutamicibacter sp.]